MECALQLIVVDNASPDGTAGIIDREFPAAKLLSNSRNVGFAAANNKAMGLCTGRYIFCLNPDCEVFPDTMQYIVEYMDAHPSIGIAGCKIINPDGSLQTSVEYRYPGQKIAFQELSDLPDGISAVLGAAMVLRADLAKRLGGFDEDFFLYGEDEDICLRARKLGFSIGFISGAVVKHIGGHSEAGFPENDVWRKKAKAELLFHRKHYSKKAQSRILNSRLRKCLWRIITLRLFRYLAFGTSRRVTEAKLGKYETILNVLRGEKACK